MSKSTLSSALLVALTATVALAGCKRDHDRTDDTMATTPPADTTTPATTPSTTTPSTAPSMDNAAGTSAVKVNSVTVGKTAAADRKVQPATQFAPNEAIIVSVSTDGSAVNTDVTARLKFQDGQVAGEQSAALNTTGMEITNIEFSNPSGWPVGSYTAEVLVDGVPQGIVQEFVVQ